MSSSNRITLYSRCSQESLPEFESNDKSAFPNVNILDDIVLKKINDKEFLYQNFFSEKVLSSLSDQSRESKVYNFPLVYNHNNKVFSMEKFDGDFESFLREDVEIDEIISCYLQIIMALYAIDSYGKFHGDLNPGNILYKKFDDQQEEKKGYIKYVIGEDTYYVKHFNKLWVVADFEYMGDKGEELSKINSSYDDFFQRLFGEHYKDMKKPIKGSWLYDMYVISHFSGASRMADRIYNMIEEECEEYMNPVDSVYHIIKNDITDLFVKK